MDQYCRDMVSGVEDFYNIIALRADIHNLFDEASFVYVPKNSEIRLHFLSTLSAHPHTQYQNSYFSTKDISCRFLFARFAWAVFQNLDLDGLESEFDCDGMPKRDDDEDAGNGKGGGKHGNSKAQRKRPHKTKQRESKSKKAKAYK
jgi:hypothetical protein